MRRPRAGILLALATFAAACSIGDTDVAREPIGVESSTTTTEALAEGPTDGSTAPGEEPAREPGVLRLGIAGAPAVDPLGASSASPTDVMLVDLLYDGLTRLDADGRAVGDLATFVASDDLSTWTFTLRADATFTDGSPVTADDVSFSLNRILGRRDSLPALRLEVIESIASQGVDVVVIRLRRPLSVLPELLSSPIYGVTQRSTMETYLAGGRDLPGGSADYRVDAVDDDGIDLVRRQGSGPESIEIGLYPDESRALDAFLAGDLDWTIAPPDRIGDALAVSGVEGLVPFHGALYLAVDSSIAPLDDLRLRQAIAASIDRQGLVEDVYGPVAQPLVGIIPEGIAAATEADCPDRCGPDRAVATTLASQVFADGQAQPIRILVEDTDPLDQVGRVLSNQLQASGIEVALDALDVATYESLVTTGQQQLFVFGWLGVARTPADYLATLFHSASLDNVTGFRSGAVDDAILAAETDPVGASRDAHWRSAEAAVLAEVGVVPLVQFRTSGVMSPRLRGFSVAADGSVDVADVTLDPIDG